jgi:hypothetical protein
LAEFRWFSSPTSVALQTALARFYCQEFAVRVDAHGQENERFEERGKGDVAFVGKES